METLTSARVLYKTDKTLNTVPDNYASPKVALLHPSKLYVTTFVINVSDHLSDVVFTFKR